MIELVSALDNRHRELTRKKALWLMPSHARWKKQKHECRRVEARTGQSTKVKGQSNSTHPSSSDTTTLGMITMTGNPLRSISSTNCVSTSKRCSRMLVSTTRNAAKLKLVSSIACGIQCKAQIQTREKALIQGALDELITSAKTQRSRGSITAEAAVEGPAGAGAANR